MPGQAGNFCAALLSLAPTVAPYHITVSPNDDALKRSRAYQALGNVRHLGDYAQPTPIKDYEIVVSEIHPNEFQPDQFRTHCVTVNLGWSNFSNFWFMARKEAFDYQVARTRPKEAAKHDWIARHFNAYRINLDCLLHRDQWQAEYQRICACLGLATQMPAAQELWHWWYTHQVEPYHQRFQHINNSEHAEWCRKRIQDEQWGVPSVWQVFYQRVRDPSWPDCDVEEEFKDLPAWIQQELQDIHGYQPGTPT